MYIIACRAHFCHLLGLGQVGHSPRETSGSDGTLNRVPCLALVRQVTPQGEPVGLLGPWTGAQCGWAPSSPATPNAPLTCLHPLMAPTAPTPPMPLYPLGAPDAPIPLLAPEDLHFLLAPNAPLTPYTPDGLHTPLYSPPPPDAP